MLETITFFDTGDFVRPINISHPIAGESREKCGCQMVSQKQPNAIYEVNLLFPVIGNTDNDANQMRS